MSKISSVPLQCPPNLQAGLELVLQELGNWLHCAAPEHLGMDWQGVHDEGTFLTAWAGYYAYTQDPKVIELAMDLFDKWEEWSRLNFKHGYHPTQEVHHGTEHFLIFLDWLSQIAPTDPRVGRALEDGSHHVGNWSDGAPPWFDWKAIRFVSYSLGTEVVGTEGFNFIDHLRLLHLALSGYRTTGESKYLNLCLEYGRIWAEAIGTQTEIPLFLDATPLKEKRYAGLLNAFLKAAPQEVTPFARVENHIASGSPKLLLEIGAATGEETFHFAAARLGRECSRHLNSPISNPAGHVLSSLLDYGLKTEDLNVTIGTFSNWNAFEMLKGKELAIRVGSHPGNSKSIGYRSDMPTFLLARDGALEPLQTPAPANLMFAWSVTGQEAFALAACSLALAKLQLARRVFRDGRHHGCTAQSIAATVRGHGRCWGAGDVSTLLSHSGACRVYSEAHPGHPGFPGLRTN